MGGHLRVVEASSRGVVWGIGYDGTAWVYTGGYGGGCFQGEGGLNPQAGRPAPCPATASLTTPLIPLASLPLTAATVPVSGDTQLAAGRQVTFRSASLCRGRSQGQPRRRGSSGTRPHLPCTFLALELLERQWPGLPHVPAAIAQTRPQGAGGQPRAWVSCCLGPDAGSSVRGLCLWGRGPCVLPAFWEAESFRLFRGNAGRNQHCNGAFPVPRPMPRSGGG